MPSSSIADDVRQGLAASAKHLPPHLFYDAAGSALYERITELPEYYPTRAEREIFETHADAIVARAARDWGGPLHVIELGAGSASKTEVLLRALLRTQPSCQYTPVDVSASALQDAQRRLAATLPAVRVRPLVTTHARAFDALRDVPPRQLVLFIGSSVGNLEDAEATRLLSDLRAALGAQATVLLGTDLRKSPEVLLPAYDDAAGVTAAFNKNVLTRINRELAGHFQLEHFRHVARWNDDASRIEMHLESRRRQEVAIDALGMHVTFRAGETIHTESSIKYTVPRVERLLQLAGLHLEHSFFDAQRRFATHLCCASERA
jgi:dimethylhistidine N-methyltransferase